MFCACNTFSVVLIYWVRSFHQTPNEYKNESAIFVVHNKNRNNIEQEQKRTSEKMEWEATKSVCCVVSKKMRHKLAQKLIFATVWFFITEPENALRIKWNRQFSLWMCYLFFPVSIYWCACAHARMHIHRYLRKVFLYI